MYAEIRSGPDAATLLARIPGAGLPADRAAFDAARWSTLSRSTSTSILPSDPLHRAAVRSFRPAREPDVLSIAVVGDMTPLEDALGSFRRALLELGLAGLGLALAGGYWLATRTLRPIAALNFQADSMASMPPTGEPHRLAVSPSGDELSRLGETFNRLLEKIDASASQMRSFIADAAHELKTPVAIVRTEAELSLSGSRSVEELREALRAIAAQSERLSRLVSDLTLLAEGQVLEQPVERRLVDLDELVQEVVQSLRPISAGREIAVSVVSAGSAEYRGDERLLRRIATNLLENAVKFSPPGARIEVRVGGRPDCLELAFLDEAETLSAQDRDRVFERFYRTASARSGSADGSGLGLAIVQWAAGLHGGSVVAEPRAPRGNLFRVILPRAPAPLPAPDAEN